MRQQVLELPAFVASLAPRNLADARRLVSLVPAGATAIEYRTDLADEEMPAAGLAELDPRPAILTCRTVREGGGFQGSLEEYAAACEAAYGSGAIVDVEFSSGLLSGNGRFPERRRVIVSRHSPFSLPEDHADLLAAMSATGALAAKLVAGAADLKSSLAVAGVQKRIGGAGVSVFPMGPASAPGRILSALFGGSLVYGSVENRTAPGQLSLAELLDTYRVRERRPLEALFGIVGSEVSESLSPRLHNSLFDSRALPNLYLPLPVADFDRDKPQELSFDPPFRGFSVTRPWKRRAAQTAVPSEDVRATGAANTLVEARRRWRAENTDVDGVFDPLADHDTGEGRTAVILGAGGAARAAVVAARKLGYEVMVASRREEAADELAAELAVDSLAFRDVAKSEADLYLNATPIGSREGDPPAFPAEVLSNRPLVFDCVYRRDGQPTSTILAARAAKCPTVEGIRMLGAQAVRQARLFGVSDATVEEVTALLAPAEEAS
ncbi:MAG TPA: type I 3-dehydroquinate dehydratase [Thermoanaerobaculia bacterium]|nr:type I 3-dehydroquinate dehydratase [Thermoanaerobaculia bacterium]